MNSKDPVHQLGRNRERKKIISLVNDEKSARGKMLT